MTPAPAWTLEVLCEGASDVPVLREVCTRRFGLVEGEQFRLHPHGGKGRLPARRSRTPSAGNFLLSQLPAKLRAYGRMVGPTFEPRVLVVVDADRSDCRVLKESLVRLGEWVAPLPRRLRFRIAVEETESWFLADPDAVRCAFPSAAVEKLRSVRPDEVCGASEVLATCLARGGETPTRLDKVEWAEAIAPHLELERPASPSFAALIAGVEVLVRG